MYFGVIRSRPTACSTVTIQHNHLNRENIIQNQKCKCKNNIKLFLISNFRPVPGVVCFLLGNSPASEFFMPTFRNTLFHFHRLVAVHRITHIYQPVKMEQTGCSETSEYKIQKSGNYAEENIQYKINLFNNAKDANKQVTELN
jgi:hypothetical protein